MKDSDFDTTDGPIDPNNHLTGVDGIVDLMGRMSSLFKRIKVVAGAYGLRIDEFVPCLDAGAAAQDTDQGVQIILTPHWIPPQRFEDAT